MSTLLQLHTCLEHQADAQIKETEAVSNLISVATELGKAIEESGTVSVYQPFLTALESAIQQATLAGVAAHTADLNVKNIVKPMIFAPPVSPSANL